MKKSDSKKMIENVKKNFDEIIKEFSSKKIPIVCAFSVGEKDGITTLVNFNSNKNNFVSECYLNIGFSLNNLMKKHFNNLKK